ncbi:MAG TPA: EamA family transporter [Firmicutes bacterium]|jgi:drug/metabolite transporter (DMT)-like permease|nr:EamA family transporter [Bacillota bacterium]
MNAAYFKPNKERNQAIFLLVITSILWSLGGLLIKSVSWNPLAIAGTRSIIAAGVMLLFNRKLRFTWSSAQIGGALAYAATVTLFVIANKLTTAVNAILLQYTAPVYTAFLGAWLLKEKTSKLDWLTIALVMGGMGLFFLDKLSVGNIAGNICAILSGVTFGATAVLLRKQKDGSPLESVILGNIITALIGLPFMLQSAPAGTFSWLYLIILGVFQLGISYILYTLAIRHVTALEAILIPIIEPILNPLWVFLVMGEAPGVWALVGGFIVLVSITGRCLIVALKESLAST